MSYTLPTQGILQTEFAWIWTSPRPDERDLFLLLENREIRIFTYEKINFFLDKLKQKLFLLYTLTTQGILHTEFGWIWKTPWTDEKSPSIQSLCFFQLVPNARSVIVSRRVHQKHST